MSNPHGTALAQIWHHRFTQDPVSMASRLRFNTFAHALPLIVATLGNVVSAQAQELSSALLEQYCSGCHNDEQWAGSLSFAALTPHDIADGKSLDTWERILRKTRLGEMPPRDEPRPAAAELHQFVGSLESALDARAQAHPDPGRATLRRLNRAEYTNAVRDLLALDIDVSNELPADDSGYGFDNIADVLSVSPTLMDRYLTVAGKVSRLAVGLSGATAQLTSYTVPKDGSIKNSGVPAYNERMSDSLPLDSRGGGSFRYYAPQDGTYRISGYLNANTNNEVDRLAENRISTDVVLTAGAHDIGMAFRRQLQLDESVQTLRNTTDVVVMPTAAPKELLLDTIVDGQRVAQAFVPSYFMSPRFSQVNYPRDVLQIDVEGPFTAAGAGDTPSRRQIFSCTPGSEPAAQTACAQQILERLARLAYRRPVAEADIAPLLAIYAGERERAGFDAGIAAAVQALLVAPAFLFVLESDPPASAAAEVHRITDTELATRLALFLWSSLPDEQLLSLAERGQLRDPAVLETEIARLLADPRAEALTENFAGQWLYLRNLEFQRPDVFEFPAFDTRLRHAMQQETELFFGSVVRENRSILDFIDADYTFLNEQLAGHYGIAGVKGTAFRRVALEPNSIRGGLLGQGSVLTVTSYANHTSVVRRGKWILDNLLAAPPPAPPPDVPALQTTEAGRQLNAREQMERHRRDPICASCHVKMDAMGFALEQFDAVGAYRTQDAGRPIDASAQFPDGTRFEGVNGLKQVLLAQKDEFAQAFASRLLIYALGRGLEAQDQPTIRAIARATAEDGYRFQRLVLAIVESDPFNLRRVPTP